MSSNAEVKEQYLSALMMVPVAWGLVYVPHFAKVGAVLKHVGPEYDNMHPRATNLDNFGEDSGFIKRAKACHENGFETFAPFAAAVILCRVQKAKAPEVARLALRFIVARILFTIFYLGGVNKPVSALRSVAWGISISSITELFRLALSS
mmetsp:Transcript_28282/g.62374  ORF Transcript_28282/g.62374 Transcript_28282/m.62374 type:complete len:150 (+) Transcript_28282:48-497(+)